MRGYIKAPSPETGTYEHTKIADRTQCRVLSARSEYPICRIRLIIPFRLNEPDLISVVPAGNGFTNALAISRTLNDSLIVARAPAGIAAVHTAKGDAQVALEIHLTALNALNNFVPRLRK